MSVSGDPFTVGAAAHESLAARAIPPTPENYAIWYEHHAGVNPALTAAINLLMRSPLQLDANALTAIHRRFFTRPGETEALDAASLRMLNVLQDTGTLVDKAGADAIALGSQVHEVTSRLGGDIATLPTLIREVREIAGAMGDGSVHLGRQLAAAGERIQTLEHALADARRQAATDALTGLSNRRSFDITLRRLAAGAMNSGDPLSLVMLDIDHFKRFNDTWGHQTGDKVLRLVGSTIRQQVRDRDVPARYGGEEFALALPATAVEEAAGIAERIRIAFAGKQLIARNSGRVVAGITVSIGLACFEPGESLADWISRADQALYAAKTAGRNRVVSSASPAGAVAAAAS